MICTDQGPQGRGQYDGQEVYCGLNAIIIQKFSYCDEREVLQQEYFQPPIFPFPHTQWVLNPISRTKNKIVERASAVNHESVVCTCSIAYMRAGIGNDRLVVCLSEYLPLRIVYRMSSMSTIEKLKL